ncbi:hypothetical protein H1235_10190 [Pseudoxanthomonas sp. NC8]|nr:hypothetical protein H1235_10190 [Pseudoxanthomonas sp. NC8]
MFKFIAILVIVPSIGIALGFGLSRTKRKLGAVLVIASSVLSVVAGFSAYVSTLYPGPESRYIGNSEAKFFRDNVIEPLMFTWLILSVLLLATLAYFKHRKVRPATRSETLQLALEVAFIGLLFLPPIAIGLSIHAAHHAGALAMKSLAPNNSFKPNRLRRSA